MARFKPHLPMPQISLYDSNPRAIVFAFKQAPPLAPFIS
jgi:hypothetical protein